MQKLKNIHPLTWIIAAGALLRLLFVLKGGEFYYGKPDFFIQKDTPGWVDSILNLINHGTYTSNLDLENGKFYRPPGYSFVIGIFYLLTEKNIDVALKLLSYVQVILDVFAIFLIYKIVINTTANKKLSYVAASLYAIYPFIIVWTPVLYAESMSVFFMIVSLYYFSKAKRYRHYALSAWFIGIATLTRLQCMFLFPIMLFAIFLNEKAIKEKLMRYTSVFTLFFILSYGLWPLRNLIIHQRVEFIQDVRVGANWSPDYLAFMPYIYSIQTDIEPQFTQLIYSNDTLVDWPKVCYNQPGDSLRLFNLVNLCRTCGTGFSYFKYARGFIDKPVAKENNCDSLIASEFNSLAQLQKQQHKLNYYLLVPFNNLKKALLKFSLYGKKSTAVKVMSSSLFIFRTFFILFGLIGIYLGYKQKVFSKNIIIVILLYSLSWYFYMCFVFRQMEIRYLLHCDILLLIPAAYFVYFLATKFPVSAKKAA